MLLLPLLPAAMALSFGAVRVHQRPNITGILADPKQQLVNVIPEVLTCPLLEEEINKRCGLVPVYATLKQFDGDRDRCEAALSVLANFGQVLAKWLGPGSNCDSKIDAWKHSSPGFESFEACRRHVSRGKYGSLCHYEPQATTPLGQPTTVSPLAGLATPALR
jgi:hypothetical protein